MLMKKSVSILMAVCLSASFAISGAASVAESADPVPQSRVVVYPPDPGNDPNWGKITPTGQSKLDEFAKSGDKANPYTGSLQSELKEAKMKSLWLYDYRGSPKSYLVASEGEKTVLEQLIKNSNPQEVSYGYIDVITGIDRSEYSPSYTIEMRTGDGSFILSFSDDKTLLRTFGELGDYNDTFYAASNIPEIKAEISKIVKNGRLVSNAFHHPGKMVRNVYDNAKKTFIDVNETTAGLRDKFDSAYSNVTFKELSMSIDSSLGAPRYGVDRMVSYLDDGTRLQYNFYEKGMAVSGDLVDLGLMPVQRYSAPADEYKAFLSAMDTAYASAPKRPYWLGRLFQDEYVSVSDNKGKVEHWSDVSPMLRTAVVSSEGYKSIANSKKIDNPKITLELSHVNAGKETIYTVTISNTQMKVAADTMNYACLYDLKNGKTLISSLEKVLL